MAVIGAIGIIAVLMTTYIAAARHRAIAAFTLSQRARAEAMADAAVNATIVELLGNLTHGGPTTGRFGQAGAPFPCVAADGSIVVVSVFNESGKVDLNTAQPDLIEALVKGVMPGEANVQRVVRDILRVRRPETDRKSQPTFETALQLEQIPDIDHRLAQALVPLVTVHSGSPGLNAGLASPALLLMVSGRVNPTEAQRQTTAFYLADVPGRTLMILAESATGIGIGFGRAAVVEFLPGPAPSYRIREWREGVSSAVPSPDRSWPAC